MKTPQEHARILEDFRHNCPAEIDGGPGIEDSLQAGADALRRLAAAEAPAETPMTLIYGSVDPATKYRTVQCVLCGWEDVVKDYGTPEHVCRAAEAPAETPVGCEVQKYSSAVCRRGTRACVVEHEPAGEADQDSDDVIGAAIAARQTKSVRWIGHCSSCSSCRFFDFTQRDIDRDGKGCCGNSRVLSLFMIPEGAPYDFNVPPDFGCRYHEQRILEPAPRSEP